MNSITIETKNYFTRLTETYQNQPEANSWSREAQVFRWNQLLKMVGADSSNEKVLGSILDFGCGTADFYQYLLDKEYKLDYTGIDIVPQMINLAKKKYDSGEFMVRDILEVGLETNYDYIFMNGIFNKKFDENNDHNLVNMQNILRETYSHANRGICFNFISTYVNFKEKCMAYFDPVVILKFCIENLGKKVNIMHHYEKCDVCVYVKK